MRRQELLRSCGEGPAQVLRSKLEQLSGSRHGNQTVVQVHRRAAPGASLPSIRVVQKKSQRARVVLAGLVVAAAVATVVAVSGGDSSDTRPRCGTNDPDTDWGVGVWPTGCWRPYADDSPFNQRLPSDPRLDPRSEQIVARFAEGGGPSDLRAGIADTSSDYQHPTYWSEKDDPEFEITCTREFGRCEVEGMRVRIPDLARPAAGSDRHLTVVDQDSGWEYDFWEVNSKPKGGGVLSVGFGGRTRIDGDGLGSNSTAAHFGNLAGIIRAQELERGRIDHALFVIADCDSGRPVYPAQGTGAQCSDPTDAPSEGTRLQLDMSDAEISALGAPAGSGRSSGRWPGTACSSATPADHRGTSSSSPAPRTPASAARTRSWTSPAAPGSSASGTAITSMWRRASTGRVACAWWTRA